MLWLLLLTWPIVSFTLNPKTEPETENRELIVAFENISVKQYAELELVLSSLNGIEKSGACERMNIFYFTYDNSIYPNAEEAFETLVIKTKIYQPLLKIGSTIADVQRECNK